jgi:hypothetical protein
MIENVMGTVRRVCRNVKRWRSASMAMRWTAAAMQEAAKGFRRLKAHKQLPALRSALEAHRNAKSYGVLESRPRKSGREDGWSFCLTAGTLCLSNQEIR